MSGTLYVGTSGFAYRAWKHGVFYPEGVRDREMLAAYATRLNSVEINATFRRFPSATTLGSWRDQTPEAFRFCLKANQRITHIRRLADADEEVRDFLDRSRVLGDRLGCVLYQCPPSLRYDRGLIEAFLGYLPPRPRAAMEFRHPSWKAARDLLVEHGVAWCVAETDERDLDPEDLTFEPFGYLRLRRAAYTGDELGRWAERIGEALAAGRDVYCYFKHEDGGASPRLAERLASLVAGTGSWSG